MSLYGSRYSSYEDRPKSFPRENVSVSIIEIGHGVFSKVYKGTLREHGTTLTVAVKILKSQERLVDEAYSEIKILQTLAHPNVVKLHGIVENALRIPPWLIFEFVSGGNLLNLVKKYHVIDKKLIQYCRDVACGMVFIHSKGILHKDLAARNILIDGDAAKVSDFGISSLSADEEGNDEYYQLAPGNPRWQPGQGGSWASVRSRAIECYTEGRHVKATDVWAFGVLLWEVWSDGEKPYHEDKQQAGKLIEAGRSPLDISWPDKCPAKIINLMQTIFKQSRHLRPEFNSVLYTLDAICNTNNEPELTHYVDYHQRENSFYNERANRSSDLSRVENTQESSSGIGWLLAGAALVGGVVAAAAYIGNSNNNRNNGSDDED